MKIALGTDYFFVGWRRFFTNQQYDKESGLYYYNARYYDPHLGSFITPDPAMDGINHYSYCNANPIKYTDPTGLTTMDYSNTNSTENYTPAPYDDEEEDNNSTNENQVSNNNNNDIPELLPQTADPGLNNATIGSQMKKSGCNLLAKMAMPQIEAKKALNSNQINNLRDKFENTKVSGGRDKSANIVRSSDLKVNNDEDILNETIILRKWN